MIAFLLKDTFENQPIKSRSQREVTETIPHSLNFKDMQSFESRNQLDLLLPRKLMYPLQRYFILTLKPCLLLFHAT